MRALASIALGLACLGASWSPTPQPAVEPFSVVISYTTNTWSARCESGCDALWSGSFTCNDNCNAVVDADGIVTLADERARSPRFSFMLRRADGGIDAYSQKGTNWMRLGWSCAMDPCKARVTENGVQVMSIQL